MNHRRAIATCRFQAHCIPPGREILNPAPCQSPARGEVNCILAFHAIEGQALVFQFREYAYPPQTRQGQDILPDDQALEFLMLLYIHLNLQTLPLIASVIWPGEAAKETGLFQ